MLKTECFEASKTRCFYGFCGFFQWIPLLFLGLNCQYVLFEVILTTLKDLFPMLWSHQVPFSIYNLI